MLGRSAWNSERSKCEADVIKEFQQRLRLNMASTSGFRGRTLTSGDWSARQNVQLLGLKDRNSFILHLCGLYNMTGTR